MRPEVMTLRRAVQAAGHALAEQAYAAVRRAFEERLDPAALAPEYGRREYLLALNADGAPIPATATMAKDFRRTAARWPAFGLWFREEALGARPVLLPARWLCHLAGLRHTTVQWFLDDAEREGYTLAQVRGGDRPEAPGCLDLPAAGHVVGATAPDEARWLELREELGLELGDLAEVAPLACYDYVDPADDGAIYNAERRHVYRGRLGAGGLSRLRFVDGEVAAIALFAVPALAALIERFPERVASGLRASWRYYAP